MSSPQHATHLGLGVVEVGDTDNGAQHLSVTDERVHLVPQRVDWNRETNAS